MCLCSIRSIFNKYEKWSDMLFIRVISEFRLLFDKRTGREIEFRTHNISEARNADFWKIETSRTRFSNVRAGLWKYWNRPKWFWDTKCWFWKIETATNCFRARKNDFWKIEIAVDDIVTRSTDFEKLKHSDMKTTNIKSIVRQQPCSSYTLCVIKIFTFHKLSFLSKYFRFHVSPFPNIQTILHLMSPPQTFKPYSINSRNFKPFSIPPNFQTILNLMSPPQTFKPSSIGLPHTNFQTIWDKWSPQTFKPF